MAVSRSEFIAITVGLIIAALALRRLFIIREKVPTDES